MALASVLGTGLLGAGFVENLLRHGVTVRVWNRTAAKAQALEDLGAAHFEDVGDAVDGVERVHLVLAHDEAVEAVLGQCQDRIGPDTWVIDHSTTQPKKTAARTERLRAAGIRYVHAPVFMAPSNARNGTGLMLLSASSDDADTLTPILQTMTGKVWHVGERPELAATHKLAGNGMLVGMAGILGDLFAIGQQHDLTPDQVLGLFEVFQAGGALPFIGKRVATAPDRDVGFELTMARKDVRLMIEAAGGADKLTVLPGIATAMDRAIAEGKGAVDFGIFAWPARPSEL